MPSKQKVLVANGQGFWGDSMLGPIRLVREGPLDYLTLDYLAEVTMSIMQKLRSRNPEAGYATDFVTLIDRILPELVAKNIKVVANAGGVNPHACLRAVMKVIEKHGFQGVGVAVVEGDDILGELDALMAGGEEFRNMDTGEPLLKVRSRVSSANVYLGAFPIAEALGRGAQIVITGRGTDPGLVLGPLIHEFGWTSEDYDRLAAGTVAGHIVECGAQCTGGNFTDWRKVRDMARVGYPIVEAYADGAFVITKHDGTGGLVDLSTVAHQLAYEMGDPRAYLGPDVSADFTSFSMKEDGRDRVRVHGVRGSKPTPTYKVSMSYADGWKAIGQLTISGPEALDKARLCSEIVWDRLALDGCEYAPEERIVEFLGANVCHAGITSADRADPSEIVLRMGVKGPDRAKVDRFGFELVPLVTSGPPGVTGFAGGRPKATEIIGFWPALMRKEKVRTKVTVVTSGEELVTLVPLARIASARSGDKGEGSNVGVIARSDAAYRFLKQHLDVERVRAHLSAINFGAVKRYEADNMRLLNFILADSLGGGGSASLKTDAQGKTHGLALLRLSMDVPESVLAATPA